PVAAALWISCTLNPEEPLKLLRDGLPPARDKANRHLAISAILQACLFESSDRARAILYRAIEKNLVEAHDEFKRALAEVVDIFTAMDRYDFDKSELDLARGRRRIETVEKVISGQPRAY
ncbi:hypothetical protein PHK61_31605, partial [Actinomycetospora lutea]|uniref:hypothetical protein n=1 Tax=Actinomycetospora lutea TaxID=663604 RepID=UPI00236557FA